jgi:hypothetical protein
MRGLVSILLLTFLPSLALAAERPEWAFAPEPAPAITPLPDDGQPKQVPGSSLHLTRKQISDPGNPPDWFPDEHPPMPQVVAHGGGPGVRACIICHLPTGLGHPENSRVPGGTATYLLRQLADFRSGARNGAAAGTMVVIAKGLTDEEMKSAIG